MATNPCPSSKCTVEQASKDDTMCCRVTLGFGDGIGLTFIVLANLLSLLSIVGLAYWIGVHEKLSPMKLTKRLAINILIISLLFADVIQAASQMFNIVWLQHQEVFRGSVCVAQGFLQQVGETAVAFHTLFIAIYTFVIALVGPFAFEHTLVGLAVLFSWCYVLGYTAWGVAHFGANLYEGPTPYWCWIDGQKKLVVHRILGEYVWIWIALAAGILYIAAYLITKFQRQDGGEMRVWDSFMIPVAYGVVALPLCIVRWRTFGNKHKVGSWGTFLVVTLFGLSGTFNASIVQFVRLTMRADDPVNDMISPTGQAPPSGQRAHNDGQLPSHRNEGVTGNGEGLKSRHVEEVPLREMRNGDGQQ